MSSAGASRQVAAETPLAGRRVDDDVGGFPTLDEGDLVVDAAGGELLADLGGEDAADVGVAERRARRRAPRACRRRRARRSA